MVETGVSLSWFWGVAFVAISLCVPVVAGVVANWYLKRQSVSDEHQAAMEQSRDELIKQLYGSLDKFSDRLFDFTDKMGKMVEYTVGHERKSDLRHEALIKTLEGVESLLRVLVKNGGKL